MIETKWHLYDTDPADPDSKPHGTAFFEVGESAGNLCQPARLIVVRTVHANGTADDSLPIVYVGEGVLYNETQFGEQWRSLCREAEIRGVANYQFNGKHYEATLAVGQTSFVDPDRGLRTGPTWLKAI